MSTTNVQGVWNFMPCPWLESSSVHGTCNGVWLIYPVTFHNLVLLIHHDNTTFSEEDTFQAIMLKVKYKKTPVVKLAGVPLQYSRWILCTFHPL